MEHSLATKMLPSISWQEIQAKYRRYGAELKELARVAKIFANADVTQIDVYTLDGNYQIVRRAWQNSVDETDGMLVLLDAEIARRNKLIGVMG